jgi:hypothetical protein
VIADCQLPIADLKTLVIADCRLPIADLKTLVIADCRSEDLRRPSNNRQSAIANWQF